MTARIATPRITKMDPVTRFKTRGEALLARDAATWAKMSVLMIQMIRASISGKPPMTKWLTEPVKAVALIMKTLVPTAVFSS